MKNLISSIISSFIISALILSTGALAHITYVSDDHCDEFGCWAVHDSYVDQKNRFSQYWNDFGGKHYDCDNCNLQNEMSYLTIHAPNIFYHTGHGNYNGYQTSDHFLWYDYIKNIRGKGNWMGGTFPGTAMMIGSSNSGLSSNPQLAYAFMSEGAWVYLGWNGSPKTILNQQYAYGFWKEITVYRQTSSNAQKNAWYYVGLLWMIGAPSTTLFSWPLSDGGNSKNTYPVMTQYYSAWEESTFRAGQGFVWSRTVYNMNDDGIFIFLKARLNAGESTTVKVGLTTCNQHKDYGTYTLNSYIHPNVLYDTNGENLVIYAKDLDVCSGPGTYWQGVDVNVISGTLRVRHASFGMIVEGWY